MGETIRTASPLQRLMYRTVLRSTYADKAASERTLRASGLELTIVYPTTRVHTHCRSEGRALRASDLEWTIVDPTTLTNKPARGAYRAAETIRMKGMPSISRADVGSFLHKAAHD